MRSASAESSSGWRRLRGTPAAARSNNRAPISRSLANSAAPWPASNLAVTLWRQVATGSPHPSTRKVHSPSRSGTKFA
ncbi:Uncharacterised protein [Mycobacteroides abscessus subsp. abscessus]|nr:Uncharacterised protein [Mycobacteroides abscessus subsp. abscessus]